jgi:hypothetical protein
VDVGVIDAEGMQSEQGEYPRQDILMAEMTEEVDLTIAGCEKRLQCPTVFTKQCIRPCMFRGYKYLQQPHIIVE